MQGSGNQQTEVRLRLTAASREPDRIDDICVLPLLGKEPQRLQEETDLKWSPGVVAAPLRAVRHGSVHQLERVP